MKKSKKSIYKKVGKILLIVLLLYILGTIMFVSIFPRIYLANKYEVSIYNSPEQENLRNLIDEYQAIEWEYKSLEECRTILWWLLGVIHRPIGFFEKVIN